MLKFSRRAILSASIALALAGTLPAEAQDGTLPGFDEAMASGDPILIHVTATWCEVCQAQKPIVADLLSRPDFASLRKFDVDFDTRKDVLRRFNVQSQSTMIVFKAGQEVDRQVGQTDPAVIEALLRKVV